MNVLKNERGVSLIEAVVALTLISIIFIAFASFFVQSGKSNSINDANIQAASIVRQYIAQYSEHEMNKNWETLIEGFSEDPSKPGNFTKILDHNRFTVEISITQQKESGKLYRELRKVHVAVWKGPKVGAPLSDSFAFHEGVVSN